MTAFTVTMSGALFDGVAEAQLGVAIAAVQREVADYAEFQWRMNMIDSFQNPSNPPVYESHANILRREADLVVNDGYPGSGLLYGPWLEGVGSRNATTRFKGYFAMRKATQSVAQKVEPIAKPIIDRFIVAANGGV